MSPPSGSGEVEQRPTVLNRQTLIPVGLIASTFLLGCTALVTAVFAHETRITVLETNGANDRVHREEFEERIEKHLDELKRDVKKLLEAR